MPIMLYVLIGARNMIATSRNICLIHWSDLDSTDQVSLGWGGKEGCWGQPGSMNMKKITWGRRANCSKHPGWRCPRRSDFHRVIKRRFKHSKPERQAGLSLGSWIAKNLFQNTLDFLPRQHFFSWLIKTGCQQCFKITRRGVSFGACLGNLTGFDLRKELLKGSGYLSVKQAGEEAWEGGRRMEREEATETGTQDRFIPSSHLESHPDFSGKIELPKWKFHLTFGYCSY